MNTKNLVKKFRLALVFLAMTIILGTISYFANDKMMEIANLAHGKLSLHPSNFLVGLVVYT